MKKFLTFLSVLALTLIAALSLVACGGTATPPSGGWQNPDDDTDRPTHEQANILVVYFSVPDNVSNSYVEIDGRQLGNTWRMSFRKIRGQTYSESCPKRLILPIIRRFCR